MTENEKEQFEMGIASYPFSQRMSIKRAMPPLVMPKKGKSSWHFLQTTTGDYRFIERTAGIVWQVSHAGGGVTFYCGGPVDRNFVSHGPRIDVASTLAHLELDKKLHLFAVLNNGALLLLALLNLAENYFDFVIEDDNIRAELVLYSTRVTKEIESEITAVKGAVLENGIENLHLFGPPLDMTILGAGKKVTVKPQPNYRSEVIRFERTGSEDKTHRNSSTVKFTKFSNVLTNAAAETTLELVVDEKKTFNVSYKDGVLAIKK